MGDVTTLLTVILVIVVLIIFAVLVALWYREDCTPDRDDATCDCNEFEDTFKCPVVPDCVKPCDTWKCKPQIPCTPCTRRTCRPTEQRDQSRHIEKSSQRAATPQSEKSAIPNSSDPESDERDTSDTLESEERETNVRKDSHTSSSSSASLSSSAKSRVRRDPYEVSITSFDGSAEKEEYNLITASIERGEKVEKDTLSDFSHRDSTPSLWEGTFSTGSRELICPHYGYFYPRDTGYGLVYPAISHSTVINGSLYISVTNEKMNAIYMLDTRSREPQWTMVVRTGVKAGENGVIGDVKSLYSKDGTLMIVADALHSYRNGNLSIVTQEREVVNRIAAQDHSGRGDVTLTKTGDVLLNGNRVNLPRVRVDVPSHIRFINQEGDFILASTLGGGGSCVLVVRESGVESHDVDIVAFTANGRGGYSYINTLGQVTVVGDNGEVKSFNSTVPVEGNSISMCMSGNRVFIFTTRIESSRSKSDSASSSV